MTHGLAEYQYINESLEEKQTNKQSIFKLDKLAQKQQLYTITCDTHTNVHTHARRIDSVRRIYSVQRPGLKAGGTLCDSFAIFFISIFYHIIIVFTDLKKKENFISKDIFVSLFKSIVNLFH